MQEKILAWYRENGRRLPWRETEDPYAILVSEIMLQQTQVSRVIPKWERWMADFPTLAELARAERYDVLAHWSGLGYNNRAVRLHLLAQETDHIPDSEDELKKLPGIGPYTARAVLAFAFNQEVPVVDTNIRRVLIHELGLPEDISTRELERHAYACIPKGRSREWHNALMDYGALVLTSKTTGIKSLSQQSRFEGSERQLRGKILRSLLQGERSYEELYAEVKDGRLENVLEKLKEDGVVAEEGGVYRV